MLYDEFASTLAPEIGHRLVIALARRDEAEALLALRQVVEAIAGGEPARPFNQIIPIWHNSANDPMLELPRFAALRARIGNQVVRRGDVPAN